VFNVLSIAVHRSDEQYCGGRLFGEIGSIASLAAVEEILVREAQAELNS
jgi:hypothetical protein